MKEKFATIIVDERRNIFPQVFFFAKKKKFGPFLDFVRILALSLYRFNFIEYHRTAIFPQVQRREREKEVNDLIVSLLHCLPIAI